MQRPTRPRILRRGRRSRYSGPMLLPRLPALRRADSYPVPPARIRFMGETVEAFLAIGDDLADLLEQRAGLRSDSSVLDIGCGYGRLAHALLRRGFEGRYLGVDVLKPHVSWSAANLGSERVDFRHLDVHNDRYNPSGRQSPGELDLGAGSFDVVAVFSVFTHMWPEDVSAYLNLIGTTLAPDGRALATFFLLDEEWRRLRDEGSAGLTLAHERTPYCRYESADEPLHRVGHDLDWVLEQAREASLEPVGPPAFGIWSRRPMDRSEAPGYQDALTFERLT